MRILIAEDSALQRKVLQAGIEHLGYECMQAVDGEDAWRQYQASGADVIISDWLMPRLDGSELCRRVRQAGGDSYPYFIFLTSVQDKQQALLGIQIGADDYLTKPLDFDELTLRLTAAERVTQLHRELALLHHRQGLLEGVQITGREVAHLLNNDLSVVVGTVELIQQRVTLPADLQPLMDATADGLRRAIRHVQQLQQVAQVEVQEVVGSVTLDLERSTGLISPDTASSTN
jgi:DNA-binding response OmpR family regulator